MVALNISQNGSRKQTAHLRASLCSACKHLAYLRGRDRLRRDRYAHDRPRELAVQARLIGREAPLPLDLERVRQCRDIEGRTGPRDHDQMRERKKLLPAPPLGEARERVIANEKREWAR